MTRRITEIKGQFVREDGSTSEFVLHLDGTSSWHQWGATERALYESMPYLEAIQEALFEAGLMLTDEPEEP